MGLGRERVDASRLPAAIGVGWRVAVVAVVSTVLTRLVGLPSGPRPSLAAGYLQLVAIALVTGAAYALVLLPLARRLPFRQRTRVIALFVPLYWIAVLSNIIEAYFDTTFSRFQLTAGAVILALPLLAVSWLVAWLLPAAGRDGPEPGIWESLRRRPLASWAWRT